MKISWLLFDADNTLLDFTSASKASLWQSFEDYHLECDDQIYATYKEINSAVWSEFERGDITAVELRRKRFDVLFNAKNIKGIDPSQFSSSFLNNLILKSESYSGVDSLLASLRTKFRVSLVTNGLKEVQRPRLEKLNLTKYFDSIVVSDEIGVAKPDQKFFDHTFRSIDNPPPKSEVLIIGDNPISDIQGGQDYGIRTCWVSNGRSNISSPNSDFTVKEVGELRSLLDLD